MPMRKTGSLVYNSLPPAWPEMTIRERTYRIYSNTTLIKYIILETAFNNILRKIWKLPRQCHTRILHCVAGVDSLFNRIPDLFTKFVTRSLSSNSTLIRSVFSWASTHAYSAVGENLNFLTRNLRKCYSTDDIVCAGFVRDIRLGRIVFDSPEATSMIIHSICCD